MSISLFNFEWDVVGCVHLCCIRVAQKKVEDVRKAKEIAQLRKETRKKESRIQALQTESRRREAVLKRKQEEVMCVYVQLHNSINA